jgi:hypothetical protein
LIERQHYLACGKPPNPDFITPPKRFNNSVVHHTRDTLNNVEKLIGRLSPGEALEEAMQRAHRALERAARSGVNAKELAKLQAQYDNLRGTDRGRMRDNVDGSALPRARGEKATSGNVVMKEFSERAAERNSRPVIRAIESKSNYQHEEIKQQILKIVDSHEKLGSTYREQLVTDVARVLKICPSAAGIVKALTLRGQGEGMTLMKDIANRGNKAIGSAYEIMGTAALGQNVSNAGNTKHSAPKLSINVGKDKVVFGAKSNINRNFPDGKSPVLTDRKTIESDILIGRKTASGYREIGVDFKHVKDAGNRGTKMDDINQIKNVAMTIQNGELHEFHFVSNGRFSDKFIKAVDKVNDQLVRGGNQPIAFHEYVSTLASDPLSDGTGQ